jgi:hypothetical protein
VAVTTESIPQDQSRRHHASKNGRVDLPPPNDPDVEKTILGSIMRDGPAAFKQCAGLQAEIFYLESHQRIWRKLAALIAEGVEEPHIDLLAARLTQSNELKMIGGCAYLASLTEMLPRGMKITHHVDVLVELWKLRQGMDLCGRYGRWFQGREPADETLVRLQVELRGVKVVRRIQPDQGTPRSTAELLASAKDWVRRFMILTDAQAIACAVYTLHVWSIDTADFTPYLLASSPTRECGKSRLLQVLSYILPRPWKVVQPSAAVLKRKLDRDHPTLLLDENDNLLKGPEEYTAAILGILNEGYARYGAKVPLCERGANGKMDLIELDPFGPKVLAGIGDILPDTTKSRCLPLCIQKKSSKEKVERLRGKKAPREGESLSLQLEAWAASELVESLRDAEPEMPEAMGDRQIDVCEHLIAIADLAGGDWPTKVRAALLELYGSATIKNDSKDTELLRGIQLVLATMDVIFSLDLASALNANPDGPWREENQGRGITAYQIAKRLKPFGIEPSQLRIGDQSGKRGYRKEWFFKAWSLYLPERDSTRSTTRMDIEEDAIFEGSTRQVM